MNVRTSIITAGMALALVAPAFTGAAAADPVFRDGTGTLSSKPIVTAHKAMERQAIRKGHAVKNSTGKCPSPQRLQLCKQLPY